MCNELRLCATGQTSTKALGKLQIGTRSSGSELGSGRGRSRSDQDGDGRPKKNTSMHPAGIKSGRYLLPTLLCK